MVGVDVDVEVEVEVEVGAKVKGVVRVGIGAKVKVVVMVMVRVYVKVNVKALYKMNLYPLIVKHHGHLGICADYFLDTGQYDAHILTKLIYDYGQDCILPSLSAERRYWSRPVSRSRSWAGPMSGSRLRSWSRSRSGLRFRSESRTK